MKLKSIYIALLLIICVCHACIPGYYEWNIGTLDSMSIMPQEGGLIEIPFSYKYKEGTIKLSGRTPVYRYRAFIDDVEYSYAEGLQGNSKVIIPRNDTYEKRSIRIDVSISEDSEKIVWGNWRTVFSSTQLGLNADEPRRYSNLGEYAVNIVVDGVVLCVDMIDNIASQCFKAMLLDGDLTLDARASYWDIQTSSNDVADLIREKVPVYEYELSWCDIGDVLLYNGCLSIKGNAHECNNVNMTYLGRVSRDCHDDLKNYFGDITDSQGTPCKITIRLDKR